MKYKTFWLIGLLCLLSVLVILKGCEQDHSDQPPAAPEGTQPQKVILRIGKTPNTRAKATGLRIDVVGVEAIGIDEFEEIGPRIAPIIIPNPDIPLDFPLTVPIILFRPPCQYKLTISADLTRDPSRIWEDVIDICEQETDNFTIDVFERFIIGELFIDAPDPVNAGETITVTCIARQISAPDSDRYPLSASLSEWRGESIAEPIDEISPVSDSFPDPFPVTLPSEECRVFTCTIEDGRSPSQTVERTITRILPTPTPTPTPTPRFTDNGDGTVTDNMTGLIWLRNANCFGLFPWETPLGSGIFPAANACNNLASGSCGLSDGSNAGDWHLPSRDELDSLIDPVNMSPVLPTPFPFVNVQNNWYWTSTSFSLTQAWYVGFDDGVVFYSNKGVGQYVWPVR